MKICFVGTSTARNTGYAKVMTNLIRGLKDSMEIFHYAMHDCIKKIREPEVPTKSVEEYGFQGLKAYCEENAVEVVFIYNDIGVILQFLKEWKPPRLWVYLDTMGHGIAPPLIKALQEHSERIYFLNSYWKEHYNLPNSYTLDHGVDTTIFKPVEESITVELRKMLNIPLGAKIILNANRNSKRKRLDLCISGFVQYCKKHPVNNYFLLLMTAKDGFYDIGNVLYEEIKKHGHDCSSRIRTIHTDKINITDEKINEFYNLADYGINTSYGEGFGLTAIEHLTLGKPQILTDLPNYNFFPRNFASFIKSTGDREYNSSIDYTCCYTETFLASEVIRAIEDVEGLVVQYTPKSWKEVCAEFISSLDEKDKNKMDTLHSLPEEDLEPDLPSALEVQEILIQSLDQ